MYHCKGNVFFSSSRTSLIVKFYHISYIVQKADSSCLMCTELKRKWENGNLLQLNRGNQILIKHVFSFYVHFAVLKSQLQNRPPPPLHPSTLYPLQCFLPVNLYPLLSWITLHTCVNKDSGSMCYVLLHVLCEEGRVSHLCPDLRGPQFVGH